MAGTVPLCVAVNTWSMPLQFFLVVFCLLYLWRYRVMPDWRGVVLGAGSVAALLYPFFSYFLTLKDGAKVTLTLVPEELRVPLIPYLMQFWPLYALLFFVWLGVTGKNRSYRWVVVLMVCFLFLIEWVNVDDLYVGRFERFNTTVKWWPWVAALITLMLAPIALAKEFTQKWARVGAMLVLLVTLIYVRELAQGWWNTWNYDQGKSFGHLDGAAHLRLRNMEPSNPENITAWHSMANYLLAQPRGVVLEKNNWEEKAFTEMGFLSLYTNKASVCGWASHQQLWRGYQRDIEQRWNRMSEFFRGELNQPLDFLLSHEVDYIIWPGVEAVDPDLFLKISDQIQSQYVFVRFDETRPEIGIWTRKKE
jgi:uncharacterized membrane protein